MRQRSRSPLIKEKLLDKYSHILRKCKVDRFCLALGDEATLWFEPPRTIEK